MNVMFLIGIFVMISIFGGLILAGLAIWALATKKETLPRWGKIVLWLFVVLAIVLLITGIVSILAVIGKFVV